MKKIIFLFLILTSSIFSQENANIFQYGIGANVGYNQYPASFSKFTGVANCCPSFTDTYGQSYGFAGILEYYFGNFGISSQLSYNQLSGKFEQSETQVFSINYEPVKGNFLHHLNFNITNLNLNLGFKFNISGLIFGLGMNVATPIKSNFDQYESINIPNKDVFFVDSLGQSTGSSIRNKISDEIPEIASLVLLPNFNLSYDIPLNSSSNIILQPQVSASYQLNNMVKNLSWKRYELNFAVNILFNSNPTIKKIIDRDSEIEQTNTKLVNDSINLEQERLRKLEQERLLEQARIDSINKAEEIQMQVRRMELARLDSIDTVQKMQAKKLADERDAFDKMIEEQNRVTGKKCKCFTIEFASTTDKNEYEKIKKLIKKIYKGQLSESSFVEPYRRIKYYKLESKCFTNHLDAYDTKVSLTSQIDYINFSPQILCQ
ncbi:MAG TPA: hypothetical protein PLE30_07115 [Candidatus Kapabacteria bacterium]|nr:hypothetical protein [Candidatus Kapabacteria bacterium]